MIEMKFVWFCYNKNANLMQIFRKKGNLPFPVAMMFPSNLLKVFPLSSGVTDPDAPVSGCVITFICNINNILLLYLRERS